LGWPFLYLADAQRVPMKWALLNGPIVSFAQQQEFGHLSRNHYRFVGMSSYVTFPRLETGDPLDYETVCEAWCHCFRQPDQFLKSAIPRALISISDFTDAQRLATIVADQPAADVRYDLIYVGAEDDWKKGTKNWILAAQCIPLICRELGLRALVVGAPTENFPPAPGVTFAEALPWQRLLVAIAGAKCLFVPNVMDASPRVIAEALCLDVPIVVNRHILGGWKYVNRFTGTFFVDRQEVVSAVRACLTQAASPREWFCANFGPYLAGQRLLRLLRSIERGINERSHVGLADDRSAAAPAPSS